MSFEGEINGFGYNKDKELEKEKAWEDKYKRKLVPYSDYDNLVTAQKSLPVFKFFLSVAVIILLVIAGYFVYQVSQDKLKSSIDQPINVNNDINQTTNNNYTYNPNTQNTFYNNFTLQLNSEAINRLCNQS